MGIGVQNLTENSLYSGSVKGLGKCVHYNGLTGFIINKTPLFNKFVHVVVICN